MRFTATGQHLAAAGARVVAHALRRRAEMGLGIEALRLQGRTTPHDLPVAAGLSRVLTGGDTDMLDPVPAETLLRLEREEFMRLVRTEGTLARIAHTLETGKPLRN